MQYGFLHSADRVRLNAWGRSRGRPLGDGTAVALIGLAGALAAILAVLALSRVAPVDFLGVILSG